ncbi:hypothetical protein FK220_004060 [Flavobacteriaceae bacterium TP-CH-4]|uniref:Uncharacterized protein n=1 Tax=Pelagihabitans pacificus TaxID=2696054 RepID=A0A967AT57_9FLAO|nr:hypothetical protein [Pelagihabitans pacificus]NHF58498.1 hypothetical protein [Pelagihabitans pacificus]
MKKVKIDVGCSSLESLQTLATNLPDLFTKCEVIEFTLNNGQKQERIKLVVGDTVYLIKRSALTSLSGIPKDREYDSPYLVEAPDAGL